MAVYVDKATWPWRGRKWAHLMADRLDELHAFAERLGLKRCWFQNPRGKAFPHYDVSEAVRQRALVAGAQAVHREFVVAFVRNRRANQEAQG